MSGTRSDVHGDVRADARADEGVGGTLYGMWFDGVNDTVLVAGSFLNAKTTGKITGVFQTTSSGIVCVCAATDETDANSDLRINISAGKLQFAARESSSHDINVKTTATYNDGEAHTFEVKVTDSGNFITIDGVLLEASELTYTTGSASTQTWFSNVLNVDKWAIGVRQEAVPDNKFLGVIRDIKIYDEDTTTVIGHWAGHGTAPADWEDQVGSNDGVVAGGPSRAISVDGGATWGEDGVGWTRITAADGTVTAYTLASFATYGVIPNNWQAAGTMTGLAIGQGVTSIGGSAFLNCGALTSLVIPSTVTSIGDRAFDSCTALTGVTIHEGVTMGLHSFEACTALTSATIASNMGLYGLHDCTSLTSVTMLSGVTAVDAYGLAGCSALTSVTIPSSVTTIGAAAFLNCTSLTSVTIPSSVTTIGGLFFAGAFGGCSALTSITIPEGVTTIGGYAFDNCSALASANIPSSVTTIGGSAFVGCSALATVDCHITKTVFDATSGASSVFNSLTLDLHVGASDATWTAGVQSLGGGTVTVVKDL